MKLKNYQHIYKNQYFYLYLLGLVILIFLLIFRLGNLVGGMSQSEIIASKTSYGWHGIYNSVIYLPLKVLRSIDFKLFKDHGQTLTRLPNIVFGFLSVISFSYIVYIWHGKEQAYSLLSYF